MMRVLFRSVLMPLIFMGVCIFCILSARSEQEGGTGIW